MRYDFKADQWVAADARLPVPVSGGTAFSLSNFYACNGGAAAESDTNNNRVRREKQIYI